MTEQQPEYPPVSVAVNREGKHVGVLYRVDDRDACLLHLGWHHKLYLDVGLRHGYAWSPCVGFEETEGRDFASWLEKIYRANIDRIPYGFNYWTGACFDMDGNFHLSREGFGLTCATFVMALFEAKCYPIVDVGTWPQREEDQAWFADIIDALKNAKDASTEHVQAQIDAMGDAVRFRPLEVAAAAAVYDEDSVKFETAIAIADKFKVQLSAPLKLVP